MVHTEVRSTLSPDQVERSQNHSSHYTIQCNCKVDIQARNLDVWSRASTLVADDEAQRSPDDKLEDHNHTMCDLVGISTETKYTIQKH